MWTGFDGTFQNNLASSKLRFTFETLPTDSLTYLLTYSQGVKCRATSVAKNYHFNGPARRKEILCREGGILLTDLKNSSFDQTLQF